MVKHIIKRSAAVILAVCMSVFSSAVYADAIQDTKGQDYERLKQPSGSAMEEHLTSKKVMATFTVNTGTHDKYISGYEDGTFRPDKNMTRAEFAQMIAGTIQFGSDSWKTDMFRDVNYESTAWYAHAVHSLGVTGIISGYEDGTFRPNNLITRAEVVTIFCNMMKQTTASGNISFTDVDKNHWALNAITVAQSKGWVKGYDGGQFRPNANITRAEAVTIANRVLERHNDGFAADCDNSAKHFADVNSSHWAFKEIMEAGESSRKGADTDKGIEIDLEVGKEVFAMVNTARKAQGLHELYWDTKLEEAAKIRAKELLKSFSHTRPDGSSCFTASDRMKGENIAAGYTTAEAVFNGWMSSAGHKDNILRERFHGMVVVRCTSSESSYKSYWVQLFSDKTADQ